MVARADAVKSLTALFFNVSAIASEVARDGIVAPLVEGKSFSMSVAASRTSWAATSHCEVIGGGGGGGIWAELLDPFFFFDFPGAAGLTGGSGVPFWLGLGGGVADSLEAGTLLGRELSSPEYFLFGVGGSGVMSSIDVAGVTVAEDGFETRSRLVCRVIRGMAKMAHYSKLVTAQLATNTKSPHWSKPVQVT